MNNNDNQFHHVYETTNLENNMRYIGVRSSKVHPNLDKYFGSSPYLPDNIAEIGRRVVLSTWDTRLEAQTEESRLLKLHDVSNNPSFYNKRITNPTQGNYGMKLKMPEGWAEKHLRENLSKESIANYSRAKTGAGNNMYGVTLPSKECEHCGKSTSYNNYVYWHGDNCKRAPTKA